MRTYTATYMSISISFRRKLAFRVVIDHYRVKKKKRKETKRKEIEKITMAIIKIKGYKNIYIYMVFSFHSLHLVQQNEKKRH